MKTLATIAAAIMILTTTSLQAAPSKRMLTLKDAMGRILTQPEYVEEATDDFPFDQAKVLQEVKTETFSRQIDLSGMSKPEASANDIPESLKSLIRY